MKRARTYRSMPTLAVLAVAAAVAAEGRAQPADAPPPTAAPPSATVEITGSRLPRAEAEAALPVTVISAEELKATGQATLAEALRALPYNIQGSTVPTPGSTGQAVTDINLRGLGYGRTLLLVNGRRVPADSNFFGFASSMEFIPLGAIERVEVLRDGASAVYGSDAIGGVINIILRRRFDHLQAYLQHDRPTGGGGAATVFGATWGTQSGPLDVVLSAEHRGIAAVSQADRDFVRADNALGFGHLSYSATPTFRATDFFGDGTGVAGPWAASAGCPAGQVRQSPGLTLTNPDTGAVVTTGTQAECRDPVANKTELSPAFNVNSLDARLGYELMPSLTAHAEALYVQQNTLGRTAPVRQALTLEADNPNNPTLGATPTNPVAGVTAPRAIEVLYQLPDSLPRVLDAQSRQHQVVLGLDWDAGPGTLGFAVQHSGQSVSNQYRNALLGSALDDAVAAGEFNPFDAAAAPAALQGAVRDGMRHTESTLQAAQLQWTAQLPEWKLGGGAIGYTLGADWRRESLNETCDELTGMFALTGAFCYDRGKMERTVRGLSFETVLPITQSFELGYAARRDAYSLPAVSQLSNRLSARLAATPDFTLRASYSEGMRAPNLFEVADGSGTLTSSVIDTRRCMEAGGDLNDPRCQAVSVEQTLKGGADLRPETSRTTTLGFVWSPARSFNVLVDYYRVVMRNQILNLDNQTVANLDALGLDLSSYGVSITRDASGVITALTSGSTNVPGFWTSGVDIELAGHWSLAEAGQISSRVLLTYVLDYSRPAAPGATVRNVVGMRDNPRTRGSWTTTWTQGPWSVMGRLNHTAGYDARTPEERDDLGLASMGELGAYHTLDAAVSFDFAKATQLTLGARNLTNRLPGLNRYAYGDVGYSTALADVNGRVWYVQLTHDF